MEDALYLTKRICRRYQYPDKTRLLCYDWVNRSRVQFVIGQELFLAAFDDNLIANRG